MKSTGIIRKVDELGRIVLPIETRKRLDISAGDGVEIFVERDRVILKTCKEPRVGMIVLARVNNTFVLHRIYKIKGEEIILRGDGNLKGCERCKVEDVLALAAIKVNDKKEYDFRSDSHLKKARIWNFLLPIRRCLLFIYKLTLKIFQR